MSDEKGGEATSHFAEGGARYARHRPTYPPALGEALAALCQHHDLAVDVGCGTGQLSGVLAQHFCKVVASDVSESQIENAAAHPKVHYQVAPAEALIVDPQTADLLVAAQAAHWFDLEGFYESSRQALKPEGVIALVTYGVLSLKGPAKMVFEHFYWETLEPHWAPERAHVETGYKKLPFPFARLETPALVIQRDWTLTDFLGYVQTWSAVRHLKKAGGGDVLDAFEEALGAAWGEPGLTKRVTWPLTVIAGRNAG